MTRRRGARAAWWRALRGGARRIAGFARAIERRTRAWSFEIRGRRVHPLGVAAVVAMLAVAWWFGSFDPSASARQRILDAIRMVESSGRDDVADGDGGLAIGPYQIHRIYWTDAVGFAPHLGGSYEDCRERRYAESIVAAYMQRWAPRAWEEADAETLARIHNGGPNGPRKRATDRYWERVRRELAR